MKWRSVNNKKPKEDQVVITYSANRKINYECIIARYTLGEFRDIDDHFAKTRLAGVTHWMKIPKRPKEVDIDVEVKLNQAVSQFMQSCKRIFDE